MLQWDSLEASCKHIMDMGALELSRTLGQGFRILLQNGLQKDLHETLESISEITVALDHYQRGGRYAPSLSDIIAARTITQHRLLSLAPPSSGIPQPDECIYNATRVAALIYSDMVLFPLPPQTGVKQKLTDMLRPALDCCTIQYAVGRIPDYCCGQVLWAALRRRPHPTGLDEPAKNLWHESDHQRKHDTG